VTLTALPTDTSLADPSVAIGFNTVAPVPEPSAIIMMSTMVALLGLQLLRGRRKHQA
jgi:hypothetical protein